MLFHEFRGNFDWEGAACSIEQRFANFHGVPRRNVKDSSNNVVNVFKN